MNKGWHWGVQLCPYQGENLIAILRKYYPNIKIVSDSSKSWSSEKSIFKKAATELVDKIENTEI